MLCSVLFIFPSTLFILTLSLLKIYSYTSSYHTIPCHIRPTRSSDLIRPGHFLRQCWADTLVDFKSVIKNDEKTLETELKKSKLISRAGPSLARQKVIKEVKVKERKKRKAKDAGSSSHNSHLAGTELGRMLEKIE